MAFNPWLLIFTAAVGAKYWLGQQYVIAQPGGTIWFSDPYQFDSLGNPGSGMFYQGSIPPGEAPPWRLASEQEIDALERMEGTGQ